MGRVLAELGRPDKWSRKQAGTSPDAHGTAAVADGDGDGGPSTVKWEWDCVMEVPLDVADVLLVEVAPVTPSGTGAVVGSVVLLPEWYLDPASDAATAVAEAGTHRASVVSGTIGWQTQRPSSELMTLFARAGATTAIVQGAVLATAVTTPITEDISPTVRRRAGSITNSLNRSHVRVSLLPLRCVWCVRVANGSSLAASDVSQPPDTAVPTAASCHQSRQAHPHQVLQPCAGSLHRRRPCERRRNADSGVATHPNTPGHVVEAVLVRDTTALHSVIRRTWRVGCQWRSGRRRA